MANFGPKPWTNPFGKISIFHLFQLLVFIAYKGVFSLQNIMKHIFLAQTTQKKRDGKMANFGTKPWTQPFAKISIFRLFQLLVFIAIRRLFEKEYHKTHFPDLDCLKKKKCKNRQFFDQNYGLTPLEKSQFFIFFNSLFLQHIKAFFRSRIS